MNKLLAKDSTAARIRALAELKSLKIRKYQSVADFCLAIEKVGSKASPQSNPEERSLEYAQILLTNLEDWSEYVFLMSAVHKATPLTAYDEIKQLAISIEQTKTMARTERPKSVMQRSRWKEFTGEKESTKDWKARYKQYYNTETRNNYIWVCGRPERGVSDRQDQTPKRVGHERLDQAPEPFPRKNVRRTPNETRKCYSCLKFGHIERKCPMRQGQVNQVRGKRSSEENNSDDGSISQIIERVYSRGAIAIHNEIDQSDMIGKRFLTGIGILGNETEALIDTASMVSIMSLGVLKDAQQRGINVDALERIENDRIKPVYDASNNKMKFLGAVYVDVVLKRGMKSRVPFHISQEKGCEVLLGTNALNNLGVSIKISAKQTVEDEEKSKESENNRVRVIKRTYIPPQSSALVTVRCDTNEEGTSYVLWATKEGFASGVYSVRSQQTTVPVNNFSGTFRGPPEHPKFDGPRKR
ncbi:hypothetical protein Y032_0015g2696 [Ancylostoma ceylanicum]|uniref:CCHC-type domain-containing protein n=1 Tax=Ancylostoma ceylanicum TaxID=53326 RepID=A0A016V9X3_9BILA|nr:hypothetical protein Y032_0015g2696 [Ancylostoma ceylanicum]